MKITYVNNVMPISAAKNSISATTLSSDRNYGSVNFCARTTPFLKTTYQKTREFYSDYKKSLGETSLQDITGAVQRITADTGHSRDEVLGAMQTVTQFANMRSMKNISEALEKDKISFIGNCGMQIMAPVCAKYVERKEACKELDDIVFDNVGLHDTIFYLISRKGFGSIKHKQLNGAFFLDHKKLKQLEDFKETRPETFEKFKNIPNLKFYMISGWDSGINFINRSKNLEEETRKLLALSDELKMPPEKAIDYEMMKRISALGINPRVIKREGVATEVCVYNQMRPEQMSINEMFNVLDANSQVRGHSEAERLVVKDTGIDFLKNYMHIYTPEILSTSLLNLHEKIVNQAEKLGYKQKDLLYVESKPEKSYSIINYAYKEINKIPDEQMIDTSTLRTERSLTRDKMLVFLDDCTISGDSISLYMNELKYIIPPGTPSLYACVCGTEKAEKKFSGKNNSSLIIGDKLNALPSTSIFSKKNKIINQLGEANHSSGGRTCVIFPYMSPDNNVGLAANIAVYHNANFRMSPHKDKITVNGTKNIFGDNAKITILSNDLTGYSPEVADIDLEVLKSPHNMTFREKVRMFFGIMSD